MTATATLPLVCHGALSGHDRSEPRAYVIRRRSGADTVALCGGCKSHLEALGLEIIAERRQGPRFGAGARA